MITVPHLQGDKVWPRGEGPRALEGQKEGNELLHREYSYNRDVTQSSVRSQALRLVLKEDGLSRNRHPGLALPTWTLGPGASAPWGRQLGRECLGPVSL